MQNNSDGSSYSYVNASYKASPDNHTIYKIMNSIAHQIKHNNRMGVIFRGGMMTMPPMTHHKITPLTGAVR